MAITISLSLFHSLLHKYCDRLSDVTIACGSNLSALSFASDTTAVSIHGPNEDERMSYYNSITGDADHPYLNGDHCKKARHKKEMNLNSNPTRRTCAPINDSENVARS